MATSSPSPSPPPDPASPAIEALIARFAGMVRRVGRGRRLSDGDVDDVLQEVRIRVWRALGTGEKIAAAPASYVYRTAVSAALDLIRRRRGREVELETLDARGPAPSGDRGPVTPDRSLERSELGERIWQAVDAIADARRAVVRMYLNGYRLDEIATLLDWTPARTRNLLYRGLGDVRRRLGDLGIGPGGRTE
jgi:RNA polymerase sigma factor (sigma-70 family)